jgi:hypothetical protein
MDTFRLSRVRDLLFAAILIVLALLPAYAIPASFGIDPSSALFAVVGFAWLGLLVWIVNVIRFWDQ